MTSRLEGGMIPRLEGVDDFSFRGIVHREGMISRFIGGENDSSFRGMG